MITGGNNKSVRKRETWFENLRRRGSRIRLTNFDDTFVKGITEIFNETPVRQGYSFPHYGKTFETVKSELSKNLHKKFFLGAYYRDELVGFSILFDAGTFAVTNHFLCKIAYHDMATANGLMARMVDASIEVCRIWFMDIGMNEVWVILHGIMDSKKSTSPNIIFL